MRGRRLTPDSFTLSLQLWCWKWFDNHLPPDFLDYPAGIVDEVSWLDEMAAGALEDIEKEREREEAKKGGGAG